MRYILTFLFITFSTEVLAQINCEAYRLEGDFLKYKACLKAEEIRAYLSI
jgi:hypothetical protein